MKANVFIFAFYAVDIIIGIITFIFHCFHCCFIFFY